MTDARQIAADVLVGLGTLTAVAAAWAALRPRGVYGRLHFPTIVSSVTGPVVAVAALVAVGPGLEGAAVVFTMLVLAVTGPVLGAAIGRLNAQLDGRIDVRSPK